MPVNLCPRGHESSESDFCSVCGAKIEAAPPGPAAAAEACPDCGAARDAAGGIFCEACGYNFSTATHGMPKPEAHVWQVTFEIDAARRSAESPDPPAGFQPVTIALSKESNLIGRISDKRGVFPEIDLTFDDAVSHRHALLNITSEGGLSVRDIGSSNGTMLNGAELPALQDTPLKSGDLLTLGHWTRLTIQ